MKLTGLDVGTMNMVAAIANGNTADIAGIRNMFIEIDPDIISIEELKRTGWSYVLQDEGTPDQKIYIIGEDSFRFAQMMSNFEIRRPMQDGVISSKDIDSIDVLTLMVERILGKTNDGYCVYSVPEEAVDVDTPSVIYHEKVFGNILNSLGYKNKPLNEAMGVVFSNCKPENFSGIGISFGCGLTNIACSYKSICTLKFAVGRGGDWIDRNVADALNANIARVTNLKEKKLRLDGQPVQTRDKREKRVLEGLAMYYKELIEHVLKHIVKQFEIHGEGFHTEDAIPIVVSGGTSMVPGFVDMFRDVFNKFSGFPYEISEIRHAVDPLNAVCLGNVLAAYWETSTQQEGANVNG